MDVAKNTQLAQDKDGAPIYLGDFVTDGAKIIRVAGVTAAGSGTVLLGYDDKATEVVSLNSIVHSKPAASLQDAVSVQISEPPTIEKLDKFDVLSLIFRVRKAMYLRQRRNEDIDGITTALVGMHP